MRAFLLVHRPSRTVHQSILSNLDAISSELLCLRALSTAPKGKSEAVHRFLPKAHHKKNPAPPAASSNAGKSSSAQHAAEEARAATEQSRSAGSPSSAPGAPPKTAPKGYFWKENSGNKGNQAHGVSQPSRFATSTPPQQPLSAGQQPAFLPPNSKFRRPQSAAEAAAAPVVPLQRITRIRPIAASSPTGSPTSGAPSLVDVSEFARMKEQFARIRAERSARLEDKGTPGRKPLGGGGRVDSSVNAAERLSAFRKGPMRAPTHPSAHHRPRSHSSPHPSRAASPVQAGIRRVENKYKPSTGAESVSKRSLKGRRARMLRAPTGREVELQEGITPRTLANRMGVQLRFVKDILSDLGENAVGADESMDVDVAEVIVGEAGQIPLRTDTKRRDRIRTEKMTPEQAAEKGVTLVPRNPVFTLLGHVDHGKTTLLDVMRGTSVAAKEIGGITQCVAGFTTTFGKKPVTFLDTPGHVLFQSMRERGAAVADIAVLVVAADDGVMPQTVSAVQTILEFGLPAVVAVTKADTCPSNLDTRVTAICNQLLEHGLFTEAVGGDVPVLTLSAKTGEGLPDLKEALLMQAELMDISASAAAPGEAVVVESTTVKGLGNVADCVVRWGTLKQGDYFVVGLTHGRVRSLLDSTGARIKEAPPSTPVRVVGLTDFPKAGTDLLVVPSEDAAKGILEGRSRREVFHAMLRSEGEIARKRAQAKKERDDKRERERRLSLAQYRDRVRRRKIADGLPLPEELKEQEWERLIARGDDPFSVAERAAKALAEMPERPPVHVVVHADTQGSLDAIQRILDSLPQEELRLKVIKYSVGDLSSGDVDTAVGANAIVVAFNVKIAGPFAKNLKNAKLTTLSHANIYGMLDLISETMSAYMPSSTVEEVLGEAEVKQLFPAPRNSAGVVAGSIVTAGEFARVAKFRLMRGGRVVWTGDELESMRRFSDDVNKVAKGQEFGVGIPYADVRQGDKIVSYAVKQVLKPLQLKL